MPNVSGNAYALSVLSPIRNDKVGTVSRADLVRDRLEQWNRLQNSPMAKVPQTYLCRFFVLDDVYTESLPSAGALDTVTDFLPVVPNTLRVGVLPAQDRLQSKYLVFSSNFHGDLDTYLLGMWNAITAEIKDVWQHCYGFDQVNDANTFSAYIKKCQLPVTLFFVGSNDEPLEEQLKGLYLKQEFARFAVEHQGIPSAELKKAYRAFIARVQPTNLQGPTWEPGQYIMDKQRNVQQEAAL
ncbi:MAG: hypothetical protein JO269_00745 [Burkholderiaceae bacterium]|nr:hypothetical protein [Burkholderiaceae bacterium]